MTTATNSPLSIAIASAAHVLKGMPNDYDMLMDLVGEARFVLLGESTHGTQEFYRERARITQRLIEEKGFDAVAIEADWPDACRVNRYAIGKSDDVDAEQALRGFERFPAWMWRNKDVVDFVEWLREHNLKARTCGFYGLDLYSMFKSMREVLRYLEKIDPEAAQRAHERYACFDHYNGDSQRYGYVASLGTSNSCEDEVIAQLSDIVRNSAKYLQHEDAEATDALFYAKQNARLAVNAEKYYRAMFRGRVSSWNLRDAHMAETLDQLAEYLTQKLGRPARIVVWEHNSHVGDARGTEVTQRGEWTVGQLAREKYGNDVRIVGFTTYQGTVTAASDWDAPAQKKRVRPALSGSYENAFHQTGLSRFFLNLREPSPATHALADFRLERAIGVIYLPETERLSHYFHASLPRQFDAVLHFDETCAVEPLEITSHWRTGEAPETYPAGV